MKVRKKILAFLLTITVFSLQAGNIRESICIVQHDDDKQQERYNKLGSVLLGNGYISAGRALKNDNRSFGSGFVFETASGKKYVVTNNHVVGTAKYVKLEFQSESGVSSFKKCPVLTSSRHYDLALVEFPAGLTANALKAYSSSVKDGQVVYTAGYPGIGNSPVWQLGKGIISNKDVNTGVLGDVDSLQVIQHTAQVDAGNSGGPLLIETIRKKDTIFYVLGINTWKAFYRENTNYSTNISDLQKFITQYESKDISFDDIDKVASDFAKAVAKGYSESYRYISEDLVLSIDDNLFKSLVKQIDTKISDEIRSNSIDGLRMLIAKSIENNFANANQVSLVSAIQSDSTKATSTYSDNKKKLYIDWGYTNNGWQITEFYNSLKGNKSKKQTNSFATKTNGVYEPLWDCLFQVGVNKLKGDSLQSIGLSIDYMASFANYGLFGTCLNFDKVKDHDDDEWGPCLGLRIGIGVQLPIRMNHFVLSPYIMAEPGINICANTALLIAARGGLRLGYEFNSEKMLYLSPEYLHEFRMVGECPIDMPHYIGAKIGFAW